MQLTIDNLQAVEVLDSRGRPTVRVFCDIGATRGWATAPSGASTGSHEAWERRDGDADRYRGLGVRETVAAVDGEISDAVCGRTFAHHRALDEALDELDGTANLGRLGANAVLATSLAVATTAANTARIELYDYFAALPKSSPTPTAPRPMINLFSGGRHAGGQVAIQDLLVISQADAIADQLHQIEQVYAAAVELIADEYGMRELTADEGGLAPEFTSCDDLFVMAARAVESSGLSLGDDIRFAVDVAASEFFEDGRYLIDGESIDTGGMIDRIVGWSERFPLSTIEDGLAEDEWTAWTELRRAVAADIVIIGDDLLCTNTGRVERAIAETAADGLLLKVNQAGSLTRATDALDAARSAGWSVTVSARSGETEDRWLADAAIGWAGDFIKVGSVRQSERLAKYNRLLEYEAGIRTFP